ncbi:hypothetical protein GCM10022291_28680 [Postechiella marina]|uniref:DUF1129 domain-containing protein n=1 Tax=Postechiella marina TaxID=943941 RepID=A0ABP8CES3_9FLAO
MSIKFSERFKTKTDSELLDIIENCSAYKKETLITAIYELGQRGIKNNEIEFLKNKIQSQIKLKAETTNLEKKKTLPIELPTTIYNASKLIYLSAAIGIINPIVINVLSNTNTFYTPINLIIASTSILVFLAYIINLGKRWARNVFTILFTLSLLAFPSVIFSTFRLNTVTGILPILQVILQGYAILLLFNNKSRLWYKTKKASN